MTDFIVLGGLLGIGVSVAIREFTIREVIGFSMLGIGGAIYGSFIASLIATYIEGPNPYITPLLIISMSLFFMGIKIALLKRHRNLSTQS